MTIDYEVTFIIKLIGFGSAVIQRLVKTSVKKNLYWEIKDRVVEESYNGTRVQKQNRKVKVYGLDSTKSVRARLVEILMETISFNDAYESFYHGFMLGLCALLDDI